jgi:hypothetical protein
MESFSIWLEARTNLLQQLNALKPQFIQVAQQVYNAWSAGEDDDLNGGGICDQIAGEIADVINHHVIGVNAGTIQSGCGENHIWVIVHDDQSAFEVDVPYHIYERGGGYNWEKIPGVIFKPQDVVISPMNYQDAVNALEYES